MILHSRQGSGLTRCGSGGSWPGFESWSVLPGLGVLLGLGLVLGLGLLPTVLPSGSLLPGRPPVAVFPPPGVPSREPSQLHPSSAPPAYPLRPARRPSHPSPGQPSSGGGPSRVLSAAVVAATTPTRPLPLTWTDGFAPSVSRCEVSPG